MFEERGAVLHRLNREAINNKGQKKMLKVEDFQKTADKWAGVPIIFAKEHPVTSASQNLAKALAEVNGKLLGSIKTAEVITKGSPRLVANLGELVQNKEFKAAETAGRLELSPAWFPENEGPRPDHLLIFEGDATHQPGDKGAMMFQEFTEEDQGYLKKFVAFIKGRKSDSSEGISMNEEEVKKIQAENDAMKVALKQKEADAMAFQEKVKASDAELAKAKKELEEFQAKALKEKKDASWNAFQAKAPKGWTNGKVKTKDAEGKETEVDKASVLRNEFEADPTALALKLVKFIEEHPDQGAEGGQEFDNTDQNKEYPSVGRWDPTANGNKGGWVDK